MGNLQRAKGGKAVARPKAVPRVAVLLQKDEARGGVATALPQKGEARAQMSSGTNTRPEKQCWQRVPKGG